MQDRLTCIQCVHVGGKCTQKAVEVVKGAQKSGSLCLRRAVPFTYRFWTLSTLGEKAVQKGLTFMATFFTCCSIKVAQ